MAPPRAAPPSSCAVVHTRGPAVHPRRAMAPPRRTWPPPLAGTRDWPPRRPPRPRARTAQHTTPRHDPRAGRWRAPAVRTPYGWTHDQWHARGAAAPATAPRAAVGAGVPPPAGGVRPPRWCGGGQTAGAPRRQRRVAMDASPPPLYAPKQHQAGRDGHQGLRARWGWPARARAHARVKKKIKAKEPRARTTTDTDGPASTAATNASASPTNGPTPMVGGVPSRCGWVRGVAPTAGGGRVHPLRAPPRSPTLERRAPNPISAARGSARPAARHRWGRLGSGDGAHHEQKRSRPARRTRGPPTMAFLAEGQGRAGRQPPPPSDIPAMARRRPWRGAAGMPRRHRPPNTPTTVGPPSPLLRTGATRTALGVARATTDGRGGADAARPAGGGAAVACGGCARVVRAAAAAPHDGGRHDKR